VERVIGRLEEPYKEPDLPEPIRALRKISSVIATGAGTNPRSLVRLINNFLLDCNLWPLIEHKEEYVALNADVAAALAFNRILQSKLEKLYPSLIVDQELCDAILDRRVEDCASKFAASAEPDELSKARPDIFSPDTTDKVKLVRELLKMPDILESLAEHGRAWLQSENLRRIVHEFSQTQRSEGGTADFPEPIARAIREALGLEQDEPIQVGSLASVVDLFLRGTQVTDEELVHLKNLSSLKRLDLGETQVTDQGLVYIKSLSSLRMLSLWGTQVTDQGLVHLQSLSSLHELYLGETQVTDAGLVHLKSISSLHFIVLFRTRVTDQGLVHLQSLSSLEALDLTGTQVTDAGLVHLKNLSSLQVLYLGETQVTDAGVEALKEALPNLRVYQQSVAIRPA
jgi:hypothetical protein